MNWQGRSIMIAGIAGFIGQRMAGIYKSLGADVYGMDFNPEGAQKVSADLGVEVELGDIRQETDCRRMIRKGTDVVINTAAVVRERGKMEVFRAINVQGLKNLAEAADEAGCSHFIHLSSIMVYGFNYEPDVREDSRLDPAGNPYCTTKIEGEKYLREASFKTMRWTVLRPGDVYGPGSIPWVIRPLQMMQAGKFFLIDGGKGMINPVFVDDLVEAARLVIDKQPFGEAFNVVDGHAVTCREYFGKLASVAGLPLPRSMPSAILHPLSFLASRIGDMLGYDLEISPEAMRYVMRPHAISNEKIRLELGFKPMFSLDRGMESLEKWLKDHRPELLRSSVESPGKG